MTVLPHTKDGLDLMQLRGGLGIAGQAMMIASGLYRGERLKVWSAGVSTLANAINLVYGVQKKEDTERLGEAKHDIDRMLGLPTPKEEPDKETGGALENADRLMQHHSVRISDGIKLGGKYLFRLAGLEAGNSSNTWHGNLSIAAKMATLLGRDEDPYTSPADKPLYNRLREQSNMVSGGLELVAQYPLFPGAINRMNKRTGQMENDWLQLGAATLFTGALVAKCFSPFTVEKINRDALFGYAASRIDMVKEEKRPAALTAVAAHLHETLTREAQVRKLPKAEQISVAEVTRALQERMAPSATVENAAPGYKGRVEEAPLRVQAR